MEFHLISEYHFKRTDKEHNIIHQQQLFLTNDAIV